MQITASQTRPGDIVRGIGLVIDGRNYNEETNEVVLFGHTSDRESGTTFATEIKVPGPHRVNVRRSYQEGDLVTIANPAKVDDLFEDEEAYDAEPDYLRRTVTFVDPESRQIYTVPEGATSEQDGDVLAVGFGQARFVL